MKKQTTKNLRSEAAIKRVINHKGKDCYDLEVEYLHSKKQICIYIPDEDHSLSSKHGEILAIIDLRELVKKRKPLTGVKKQLDAIVRGSKKKGKK